jgi:hypothetical protein
MSRVSKVFTPLNVEENIEKLISKKKLYALVSSVGPIKRYSRVTHYEQVESDCGEFTLADGSVIESFVDEDKFEGVFIKIEKIQSRHASHAAGGGTRRNKK